MTVKGADGMERATLDGVALEFEISGSGEPVVLIHAGVLGAVWFDALVRQPALADRHRVLRYDRAGYGNSSRLTGPVTIADHAAHCRGLMSHVGVERAHVVGHSSSAMIALQLALDVPDIVHTLALLESARPSPTTAAQTAFATTVAVPAMQCYERGDHAGAVDTWMTGVAGPGYRATLDAVLPKSWEQAVEADSFFGQELPAVQQWSFTAADAARITQPVLAVLGADSVPTFAGRRQLLREWMPHLELGDLPDTGHLLHAENPRGVAALLAAFFGRYPIPRQQPPRNPA